MYSRRTNTRACSANQDHSQRKHISSVSPMTVRVVWPRGGTSSPSISTASTANRNHQPRDVSIEGKRQKEKGKRKIANVLERHHLCLLATANDGAKDLVDLLTLIEQIAQQVPR